MGDVGSRAFLLGIGFQLAALHPELFALEQIRITVEQRVGDFEDRATVIGAEIDKIIISPFHQVVLRIQQEVQRVGGQVTGLHIGEWVADPHSLTESHLLNMALFDPTRALAQ